MYDVPERFTEKPVGFEIKMPDGTLKPANVYRHYNRFAPHISEHFDKMLEGYEVTGAARKVRFGDAECILCDANALVDVTEKVLKHQINCFIECEEIPKEWYL